MVRIEIRSTQHTDPLLVVEADPAGCTITGERTDLIDLREPLLGLPSGLCVTAADAPEEWARGLALRFRSPDLTARVVHDDDHAATEPVEPIELGHLAAR